MKHFYGKSLITLALFPVLLLVIGVSGCSCGKTDDGGGGGGGGKSDEELVSNAIERRDKARTIEASVGDQAAIFVKDGEGYITDGKATAAVYSFAIGAQSYIVDENFRAAYDALTKAQASGPEVNAPHYLRAELLYQLALFDMLDRSLCTIELKPVDQVQQDQLRYGSPLGAEVEDLITNKSIKTYDNFLTSSGVDKRERGKVLIYLHLLDKDQLDPQLVKLEEDTIQRIGPAKAIPIPHYKPDTDAKRILEMAQEEMEAAEKGTEMETPPGVEVINKGKMRVLSNRIQAMLHPETAQSNNTPSNGQATTSAELKSTLSDEEFNRQLQRIEKEGTGNIPGMAPQDDHPDNLLIARKSQYKTDKVKTKEVTVPDNWKLSYKVSAPKSGDIGFFVVNAHFTNGKAYTLIAKQQLTDEDSDLIIYPQGGSFYLEIASNVPYAIDVRRGR